MIGNCTYHVQKLVSVYGDAVCELDALEALMDERVLRVVLGEDLAKDTECCDLLVSQLP